MTTGEMNVQLSTLEDKRRLAECVLGQGLPILEGSLYLAPAENQRGVMGLAFGDDATTDAIYRVVFDRQGDPGRGDTDFVDRSELHVIKAQPSGELTTRKLEIEGAATRIGELTRRLQAGLFAAGNRFWDRAEYIGSEDPTQYANGSLHAVYTHAHRYPSARDPAQYEYWFTLGHAVGPDIDNLREVDTPTVSVDRITGNPRLADYCKEFTYGPQLPGNKMWVAVERAYSGYSTIAVAQAPHTLDGPWEGFHIPLHPVTAAARYGNFYGNKELSAEEQRLQWAWIEDHVSPCAFVDIPDIYGKGLKGAIVSARSATTQDWKHGPFRIGVALFDPSDGSFPWVAPFPMLSRRAMSEEGANINIEFGTYYDPKTQRVYWHENDTTIHSAPLTEEMWLRQLPPIRQVEKYYRETTG